MKGRKISADFEIEGVKYRDLPEMAYALLHTNGDKGDCIIVKKGESGYYPTDWPKGGYNQEMIDRFNEGLGLSKAEALFLHSQSFWKEHPEL